MALLKIKKVALVELAGRDYVNIYALVRMLRGIPLLAAILEQEGYQVTCYGEGIAKFDWQELLSYDAVGFSIISCTANPTYAMIRRLRKAVYNGIIIAGGPHATERPGEALK